MSPALYWLLALTQIPALRALARYLPLPELGIPALLIMAAGGIALLLRPNRPLHTVLNTPWPAALLLMFFSLAIALVYPVADGLKATMGGSDADDAIQLGAVALWHLHNPYLLTTYLGGPLTPGPGWLALWGPLVALNLQPLGPMAALAFTLWAFRQSKAPWVSINTIALVWASCLAVWELALVGNDLITWGMLLVGVMLLLTQPRLPFWGMIGLALMVGAMATARISFFYLPLLIGFALLAVWPKRALWVGGVGMLTMALWHYGYYTWSPAHYTPLLLLNNGTHLMSPTLLVGAIMALGTTGAAMLYHWRWWPPFVHVALGLGAPLSLLALAQLASHGHFTQWEGATWLLPALPVALVAVLNLWPLPRTLQTQGPALMPKKESISATKNQTPKAKPLAKRPRAR